MSLPAKKLLFAGVLLFTAGVGWAAVDWYYCLPADRQPLYVGRKSCVDCHRPQAKLFAGSHHDLAMDPATPETVLGQFQNQEIEHHEVTSRLFREGDRYFVNTDGPNGQLEDFEIKFVFGVAPLQQYLVELPASRSKSDQQVNRGGSENDAGLSRLQVLPMAWDTEKERWYYVNPDELAVPGDPLHWTGWAQTWNHMCADCHSTNLEKNYHLATDSYHTTFSEIDVSCEACHGPGDVHVELANSNSLFWDRHHGYGVAQLKVESSRPQISTCAPCHSRRDMIMPGFRPGEDFFDHYRLTLLDEHLYYADGQIQDEVYVYGSFLQSRMYRENVRCTDCHDPHSNRLLRTGNSLCTKCHEPAKYDASLHHHHQVDSTGASCVECHMPDRAYMGIDRRRDHSIRMPRPDVSVELGTPNACTGCHLDKELVTQADEYPDLLDQAAQGNSQADQKLSELDQWAADSIVSWYGAGRPEGEHFGISFAAARNGNPNAVPGLLRIVRQPQKHGPIVRATAAAHLAGYSDVDAQRALRGLVDDKEALVRSAAVMGLDPTRDSDRLLRLVADPVRLVRDSAVRVLLTNANWQPPEEHLATFKHAVDELVTGRRIHDDLAGAHMDFAMVHEFFARRTRDADRLRQAMSEYEIAIQLQPELIGPRSNLAILHEEMGELKQANVLWERELDRIAEAIKLRAADAGLRYQQASLLYKLGNVEAATDSIAKACELAPFSTRFRLFHTLLLVRRQMWDGALSSSQALIALEPQNGVWVHQHGLILYAIGRLDDAERYLQQATSLGSGFDLSLAILLAHRHGQWTRAIDMAQRLVRSDPANELFQRILFRVQQAAQQDQSAS